MTKKQWKIAWQRARLNRRHCHREEYEFYRDSNTLLAYNILQNLEFFKLGIF